MTINKLKVLHVVGDSRFGGASIIIMKLAELAREMGCDVDVLTNDKKFNSLLLKNHIGVIDLDLVRRKTSLVKDFVHTLRLAALIRRNKYDLVHTHTTKGGLVGRLAARLASSKCVIHTVHGFAFHEETGPGKTLFFAQVERIAAYWCHYIITVSHFHREWALKLGIGNPSQVIAIPNGISIAEETHTKSIEEVRFDFRVPPNSILLFCGGRLAEQKGLEYLLEAMPTVNVACNNEVRLVIAGEGDLETELKKMATNLGLDVDDIFVGFRRDIANILRAADLVILPSLREGLSISLLEAMAAGKAIITTTIGSNLEATRNGEGAMLVAPKNSEELADAIIKLSRNKELRTSLASNSKAIYINEYTEVRMLESYRELYSRCLNS